MSSDGSNPISKASFNSENLNPLRRATSGVQQPKQDFDQQRTKEAAEQFEALLLHQMFKSMWSSVPKDSLLGNSREEEYYQDMFTEGLANEVAKGQGIGIKEVIAKDLLRVQSKK
ncbi:MAG: hypothetical protein DCC75_03665 [Proteobacteria bacterium]|nr:MAG: hypothetical protein DCC75_03665 [Pseudomonadota bacterium]